MKVVRSQLAPALVAALMALSFLVVMSKLFK